MATLLQSIAESGIIKSLEMKQFMCHEYLTFKFGPQVNFIVGTCSNIVEVSLVDCSVSQDTMEVSPSNCSSCVFSALIFLFLGGKSAVLTALTVALGGKAALTGRGNGLKSFIKEGKTYVHQFLNYTSSLF